jgi:ADP-heptose:LPS heptosyltransferase
MKILIVQIGRLGDMILTTPIFRVIKEKMPGSEVHVLASVTNHRVILNNKFVDKFFIYKKDPLNLLRALYNLNREKYDVWIDPKDHHSSESKLLIKLIRANTKIGFNRKGEKVFDFGIPSDEENLRLHLIERNLNTLKFIGIEKKEIVHPDIFITDDSRKHVNNRLEPFKGKKIILINISVNVMERFWPVKSWRELIYYFSQATEKPLISNFSESKDSLNIQTRPERSRRAFQNEDLQFVVTYLKNDIESAEMIVKDFKNAIIFHDRNLNDLSAIVEKSDLVISPDTSLIHFASAFNKPTVALFQNVEWNYNKFKPLNEHSITLMPEVNETVEKIEPGRVIEVVKEILEFI